LQMPHGGTGKSTLSTRATLFAANGFSRTLTAINDQVLGTFFTAHTRVFQY